MYQEQKSRSSSIKMFKRNGRLNELEKPEHKQHRIQGFSPGQTGGPPRWWKFCTSPQTKYRPRVLTRACPLQLSFVPENFKHFTSFSLNFDYFLAQNCIRKLYFMLKTPKIALFCWGGYFWPQRKFFQDPLIWLCPRRESPPSDSIPNGDRKLSPKASPPPPPKILWKTLGYNRNPTGIVATACLWLTQFKFPGMQHSITFSCFLVFKPIVSLSRRDFYFRHIT